MLLYEEYEDCITDRDYNYDEYYYNRGYFYALILFREYEEAGFNNVADWWKACCEKECKKTGEIYMIDFSNVGYIILDQFRDEEDDPNLYAEIFGELP